MTPFFLNKFINMKNVNKSDISCIASASASKVRVLITYFMRLQIAVYTINFVIVFEAILNNNLNILYKDNNTICQQGTIGKIYCTYQYYE